MSVADRVADGIAVPEVDEGNGAARLRGPGEHEALVELVEHDAGDVRQVEAAGIVQRQPVEALKLAGARDLCGVALDRLGVGDEEARIEAARAVGRGDGAGDEVEMPEGRGDALREIVRPVGMLARLRRGDALAEDWRLYTSPSPRDS